MSGDDLFLDVAGGKKVHRFLLPAKKHEFVIGSGKDADFRIGKRGLVDEHLKLTRNANTGDWHAQDLSNTLFTIQGSTQKRSTAEVKLKQAITLNEACIIRLSSGKASLSDKFLSSKSIGGMGALEYMVIILAPISVLFSVFLILAGQKSDTPVREADAHLKCYAIRSGVALTNYNSGSSYLERVWPGEYYDCVRNAEASCQFAASEKGEDRENYREAKKYCGFLSTEKEESDKGVVSIDYYTSENPAKKALQRYERKLTNIEGGQKPKNAAAVKEAITQVCFSCDDLSKLKDGQREACETASSTAERLERARELWSAGRSKDALTQYKKIKDNSVEQCEAYKASDWKTKILWKSKR